MSREAASFNAEKLKMSAGGWKCLSRMGEGGVLAPGVIDSSVLISNPISSISGFHYEFSYC